MTMRAILVNKYGGPEVLQLAAKVAIPAVGDNQLRIKVKYAGVNPVDTYIRTGGHSLKSKILPYIPGRDGAGVVDVVGKNVKRFKVGDKVYFCFHVTGGYAEYCTVSEDYVFKLHDYLSFCQGAGIGIPYFTAYKALVMKAEAKEGQSVLIHGASGGVGLACCQIAKNLGLKVFGTAGTQAGLELVRKNGADHVFNHRSENYTDEIQKLSGDGLNIVIEMLANVNLERDLQLASMGGNIVIVGSRDKIEITPRLIFEKDLRIQGVTLPNSTKAQWLQTGNFFDEGQKRGWLLPVIGKEYKLEDAQLAHKDVIEHRGGTNGKIVLKVADD